MRTKGSELALVDAHLSCVFEDTLETGKQDEAAMARHPPKEERHRDVMVEASLVCVGEQCRELVGVDPECR
jgi:hypothetical protein